MKNHVTLSSRTKCGYEHAVVENYSRQILAWNVARAFHPGVTAQLLFDTSKRVTSGSRLHNSLFACSGCVATSLIRVRDFLPDDGCCGLVIRPGTGTIDVKEQYLFSRSEATKCPEIIPALHGLTR